MSRDNQSVSLQRGTARSTRFVGRAVVITTAVSLPLAGMTEAAIRRVDPSAMGANDGTSWTNAYISLQLAIANAVPEDDDEIWIRAGTYKPTSGSDRSDSFILGPPVSLYGGFAGTESTVDQRDLSLYETVLSGDLSGNDTANFGNRADNSYHVVRIVGGESERSILDGLTIRGGNADGDFFDDDSYGGGVFVGGLHSGEIKVFIRTQCRIEDNSADRAGGGVASGKGSGVELRDSLVSGNRTLGDDSGAYSGGGGVSTEFLIATRCRFEGNVAHDGPGGALMLAASAYFVASHSVVNVEFVENLAGSNGGAAQVRRDVDFANCLFARNEARDDAGPDPGVGGAIATFGGLTRILNSTIADNLAFNDFDPGTENMPGVGAGLYLGDGDVQVRNSVLWGNRVDNGSGLASHHLAQMSLYAEDNTLATTELAYSNVENYRVCQGIFCPATIPDFFNIGDDLILHDPLFADPASDNYRHRSFYLMDVGNDADLPDDVNDVDDNNNFTEKLPLDLRLEIRKRNAAVDMGAYEWCKGDYTGDGVVDGGDVGLLTGYWGPCPEFDPCPGDLDGNGLVDGVELGIVLAGSDCSGWPPQLLLGSPAEFLAEEYAFESVEEFFEWLDTLDAEQVSAVLEPLL